MSGDDSTPQEDQEPAPAGEGPEPAPTGEEPEPAPSGEGPEPAPSGEEAEPAPSDSSAGDSGSSGGKRRKSSGASDDSDSPGDSAGDAAPGAGESCVNLSEDDVQAALVSAFERRNVPVEQDGVKVTKEEGLFHLSVRLTADATPLPQVPDDTSNLAPGSVQGAQLMVLGAVQAIDGGTRVTMRVVRVETSEILQTGSGDAIGTANTDAVQAAAEDAMATLDMLHTQ